MPRKLVVVVDDDWDVLTSLRRLLIVSGFKTETYNSGEAFLASTACSRASCLVLDINLGDMSGLEVRKRLTASGFQLPTIFMTAFSDEAAHHAATEAGCVALLRKPFPAKTLIAAIEEAA